MYYSAPTIRCSSNGTVLTWPYGERKNRGQTGNHFLACLSSHFVDLSSPLKSHWHDCCFFLFLTINPKLHLLFQCRTAVDCLLSNFCNFCRHQSSRVIYWLEVSSWGIYRHEESIDFLIFKSLCRIVCIWLVSMPKCIQILSQVIRWFSSISRLMVALFLPVAAVKGQPSRNSSMREIRPWFNSEYQHCMVLKCDASTKKAFWSRLLLSCGVSEDLNRKNHCSKFFVG